jgi:HAE1 family hydrophobic/amphiphilic exporter-1
MKLWDLSIRQPVFMTMILASMIVLGTASYFRLPIDLLPDIKVPIIAVQTIYPGAGPDEVAEQVTKPLEDALNALPGVEGVNSTSSESSSLIIIEFSLDTEVSDASREVLEKINRIQNQLPTDAFTPVVLRFDPADQPMLVIGVADATGTKSPAQLRQEVEDRIQSPLERIDGVASVEVNGGDVREVQVLLDLNALQSRRIAPQQVSAALRSENLNIPGGSITDQGKELLIRTPGNFRTVEEIGDVVVAYRGAPVYLRDVATVQDGFVERTSFTLLNGKESVVVNIKRQSGSNSLAVADKVKAELEKVRVEHTDLTLAEAQDTSIFVRDATNDAISDLLLGGLLAGLVVLYFFRNLRNTLITMSGLPVIVFGTLFLMDLAGVSLNMVSLLALALSVGLVIDDAIVVRENIFRWMNMGYSAKVAASKATEEVVLPVLATSAAILAVFLPVAYASGIIGQIFRDFGLTVAFAIIVSTFEALTMAPMLSAYFFARGENEEREIDESAGDEMAPEGRMYAVYGRILGWVLHHRGVTGLISAVVLVVSIVSAGFIQQAFLPGLDQRGFSVLMELPKGTTLAITKAEAAQVESIVAQHPIIENVFTTIGGQGTPEKARITVTLKEGPDTREVIDQLRGPLAGVPGLAFQISDSALSAGTDVAVNVKSLDGNQATLIAAAEALMAQMKARPELVDVSMSYEVGKPEVRVAVDRSRAAQFGLNTAQIGSTVRSLINGEEVSTYRGEGTEADIRVQLQASDRANVEDILQLGILSPAGQLVPLRNVAETTIAAGPSTIKREDRQAIITVNANSLNGDGVVAQNAAVAVMDEMALPAGVEMALGGDASLQADSFSNLLLALALSIVFIYMVLASQFASFTQPLLIMLSMPLAVVGAILALVASGSPLDMTAMIGFIMLMGLVTKNSILLVDFANRQRSLGHTAVEAMRIAGPVRLRPILMTAISLILGMAPVAAGLGAGGDFRAPMAIGIIGGMMTSTFLTLFIVPVAYSLLVGWQDKRAGRGAAVGVPSFSPVMEPGD